MYNNNNEILLVISGKTYQHISAIKTLTHQPWWQHTVCYIIPDHMPDPRHLWFNTAAYEIYELFKGAIICSKY